MYRQGWGDDEVARVASKQLARDITPQDVVKTRKATLGALADENRSAKQALSAMQRSIASLEARVRQLEEKQARDAQGVTTMPANRHVGSSSR